MAEFKNPFRNVKIEYRRSSPLTKVVVIAAILLSMAALITLGWTRSQILAEIEDMRTEAAQLESENEDLQEKIDDLESDSVQGILDIAEDELDLVNPDTVIIDLE